MSSPSAGGARSAACLQSEDWWPNPPSSFSFMLHGVSSHTRNEVAADQWILAAKSSCSVIDTARGRKRITGSSGCLSLLHCPWLHKHRCKVRLARQLTAQRPAVRPRHHSADLAQRCRSVSPSAAAKSASTSLLRPAALAEPMARKQWRAIVARIYTNMYTLHTIDVPSPEVCSPLQRCLPTCPGNCRCTAAGSWPATARR